MQEAMLRNLFKLVCCPVNAETRQNLRQKWLALPADLRTSRQLYGRHDEGCGATVGVMPRCDFGCRGCYLGKQANAAKPRPLDEIKTQIRLLRTYLGQWGNLQLTDGEVTLRPEGELIELLKYARRMELIPMLMTHGDTFRRRPGMLERLVTEGGLREISIHVDTTQRGRLGAAFRRATREQELHPLRSEFADMIRSVRRQTGRPLRAASTVTVTRENLADVPGVVKWFQENSDIFHMVSFLPAAQVGRTVADLGEVVDRRSLWRSIIQGLSSPSSPEELTDANWWLGHPDCNQILTGLVRSTKSSSSRRSSDFFPLSPINPHDRRIAEKFFDRFAGLTFRADSRVHAIARSLGMILRAPWFTGVELPCYAIGSLRRFSEGRLVKFVLEWFSGRSRIDRLTIVTHHFMNAEEIQSPLGKERVKHCAFRVPFDGDLVSMCEFNATDARQRFYDGSVLESK